MRRRSLPTNGACGPRACVGNLYFLLFFQTLLLLAGPLSHPPQPANTRANDPPTHLTRTRIHTTHPNRALELKPKYARGWLNMGISHANLSRYHEAARCYLQVGI